MNKPTNTEIRKAMDKISIALSKIHDVMDMGLTSTSLINAERDLQRAMSKLSSTSD